jgi:hypothetical protein
MISAEMRIISLHKIYEKNQIMHFDLINVTLLDSDHRHVAAIFRAVSARIQIYLVCRVQSTVKLIQCWLKVRNFNPNYMTFNYGILTKHISF